MLIFNDRVYASNQYAKKALKNTYAGVIKLSKLKATNKNAGYRSTIQCL